MRDLARPGLGVVRETLGMVNCHDNGWRTPPGGGSRLHQRHDIAQPATQLLTPRGELPLCRHVFGLAAAVSTATGR